MSGVGSTAMILGWFGFALLVIVTIGLVVMILTVKLLNDLAAWSGREKRVNGWWGDGEEGEEDREEGGGRKVVWYEWRRHGHILGTDLGIALRCIDSHAAKTAVLFLV
jgi:hypothetical protein